MIVRQNDAFVLLKESLSTYPRFCFFPVIEYSRKAFIKTQSILGVLAPYTTGCI